MNRVSPTQNKGPGGGGATDLGLGPAPDQCGTKLAGTLSKMKGKLPGGNDPNAPPIGTYCGFTYSMMKRSRDEIGESVQQAPPLALWWGAIVSRICFAPPTRIGQTLSDLQTTVGKTIATFYSLQDEDTQSIIQGHGTNPVAQMGGGAWTEYTDPHDPNHKIYRGEDGKLRKTKLPGVAHMEVGEWDDLLKTKAGKAMAEGSSSQSESPPPSGEDISTDEEDEDSMDPQAIDQLLTESGLKGKVEKEANEKAQKKRWKDTFEAITPEISARWIGQWEKCDSLGLFETPALKANHDMTTSPSPDDIESGLPELNHQLFNTLSEQINEQILEIETDGAMGRVKNEGEIEGQDMSSPISIHPSSSPMSSPPHSSSPDAGEKKQNTSQIKTAVIQLGSYANCFIIADPALNTLFVNFQLCHVPDENQNLDLDNGTYSLLCQLAPVTVGKRARDDPLVSLAFCALDDQSVFKIIYTMIYMADKHLNWTEQTEQAELESPSSTAAAGSCSRYAGYEGNEAQTAAERKVYITGFSMGGALAALFSLFYSEIRYAPDGTCHNVPYFPNDVLPPTAILTTYGAPPCGTNHRNAWQAQSVNRKMQNYIDGGVIVYRRYVTQGDPISRLTPNDLRRQWASRYKVGTLGYTHMGTCCGSSVVRCPGTLNIFDGFGQTLTDGIRGLLGEKFSKARESMSTRKYDVKKAHTDPKTCRNWTKDNLDNPGTLKIPEQHGDQCGIRFFLPLLALHLSDNDGVARGRKETSGVGMTRESKKPRMPLSRKQDECSIYLPMKGDDGYIKLLLYPNPNEADPGDYTDFTDSTELEGDESQEPPMDDVGGPPKPGVASDEDLDHAVNSNFYKIIKNWAKKGDDDDELKKKLANAVWGGPMGSMSTAYRYQSVYGAVIATIPFSRVHGCAPKLVGDSKWQMGTREAEEGDDLPEHDQPEPQIKDAPRQEATTFGGKRSKTRKRKQLQKRSTRRS